MIANAIKREPLKRRTVLLEESGLQAKNAVKLIVMRHICEKVIESNIG